MIDSPNRNHEIEHFLQALKSEGWLTRKRAADALGKFGDDCVVPYLVDAMKDKDSDVRTAVAKALGAIGDDTALFALKEGLKSKYDEVRWQCVITLGLVGDVSVVSALASALGDTYENVDFEAVKALSRMGNSDTLPRKILACSKLSAQEKVVALNRLRSRFALTFTSLNHFPKVRPLCELAIIEENQDVRDGAQTVLNWLEGDKLLLHASQRDSGIDGQQLLRAAGGVAPDGHSETLLRGLDEPVIEPEKSTRLSLLQRLKRAFL